jgi:hypothetical protein
MVMAAEENLPALWQGLVATAEKNAVIISNEVINDAVLGKSVTSAVSPYFASADKSAYLRDEFAAADQACHDLRAKAHVTMQRCGLDAWDMDDLKAADEDLWRAINQAAEHASLLNRKRQEAKTQAQSLRDNAIDVIDNCAGIATLRHLNEFRCEGDAFCTAYVSALSIADYMIGKSLKANGMKMLSDFLQFTVGVKAAYRHCDVYTSNKTIFGIGRTLGIESTDALSAALILAIKKNTTMPSQLKPQIELPADKGSYSTY